MLSPITFGRAGSRLHAHDIDRYELQDHERQARRQNNTHASRNHTLALFYWRQKLNVLDMMPGSSL